MPTPDTYTNRSNAARAARKALAGQVAEPISGVHFIVSETVGGFTYVLMDLATGVEAAKPEPVDAGAVFDAPTIEQVEVTALPAPPAQAKPARARKPKADAGEAPRESKRSLVLNLLARKEGAAASEIAALTGWQAHTIRGFMSTAPKKAGLTLESTKSGTDRVYRTHPAAG